MQHLHLISFPIALCHVLPLLNNSKQMNHEQPLFGLQLYITTHSFSIPSSR